MSAIGCVRSHLALALYAALLKVLHFAEELCCVYISLHSCGFIWLIYMHYPDRVMYFALIWTGSSTVVKISKHYCAFLPYTIEVKGVCNLFLEFF